jgi:hypothetical protein
MLQTFSNIQSKVFASTGSSISSTLKQKLTAHFRIDDIPEGFLYLPMSMGGLDLKSPFVNLYLIQDNMPQNPDAIMDDFFAKEQAAYDLAGKNFDEGKVEGRSYALEQEFKGEDFLSFEEYTRHRERTSQKLYAAYLKLIATPHEHQVEQTSNVTAVLNALSLVASTRLTPYYRWIIELYADDMIKRFGGLTVVETGFLPTGIVSQFRESRFKWQD